MLINPAKHPTSQKRQFWDLILLQHSVNLITLKQGPVEMCSPSGYDLDFSSSVQRHIFLFLFIEQLVDATKLLFTRKQIWLFQNLLPQSDYREPCVSHTLWYYYYISHTLWYYYYSSLLDHILLFMLFTLLLWLMWRKSWFNCYMGHWRELYQ